MAAAELNKNGDTDDIPQLDPDFMKILVLGESKCGKTTFIRTFARDNFAAEIFQEFGATVYPYDHYHFGVLRKFAIVEIPGVSEEDLNKILHRHMYAKGCIFMFAVDDPSSLLQLQDKWIPALEYLITESEIPAIAVGFKVDLRGNTHIIDLLALANLTPVTLEEGQSLTEIPQILRYFECSQNDLQIVNEIFYFILNSAYNAASA